MNLPRFSVQRPVFTTVIFIVMILFGIVSLIEIPVDLFPEIEPPAISVITIYRGAGAAEIEEKINKPLEDVLASINDLKDIQSVAQESISNVTCTFEFGVDLNEAANSIRDKLEFAKRRLPEDADQPMVVKFNLAMFPVLFLGITSGEIDIKDQSEVIEDFIIEPLQRIPGVASVVMLNANIKQVIIALDRDRLSSFNLSVSDVMKAVSTDNLSLPAGHMKIGAFDYTLRVPGEYEHIDEIKETIVVSTRNGLVRVKDVARVFWGSEELQQFGILDNRDMVFLMVQKQSGVNTVEVAKQINEKLQSLEGKLPHGMNATALIDTSVFITDMVNSLSQAVYVGGFFVILVVVLFLRRLRSSLIIVLSIPASLIIAFAFLYAFDYTLNMISLMSLSLAIGMVVDNSIVVLDNITRHLEWGESRVKAAVTGTIEVGGAIFASTLTTVMIFAPLFFIGGFIGIMFKQLAGVIIITLSASLISALLLSPMLSSKILKAAKNDVNNGHKNQKQKENDARGLKKIFLFSENMLNWTENHYANRLRWVLKHKMLTTLVALSLFGMSLFILPIIGLDFMPKQDSGDIQINFELPLGTEVDETYSVARKIAGIIKEEVPELELIFMRGGESTGGMSNRIEGTNTGLVGIKVCPLNERDRSVLEIADAIRVRIEEIPGIDKLDIMAENPLGSIFTGGQKPVTIQILSKDFRKAEAAAARIMARMDKIEGLTDLTTDLVSLKPELQVKIDRIRANQVGLNVAMIADAVNSSYFGSKASLFREGGDEYDIIVKLKKADRKSVDQMLDLDLKTYTGKQVKLRSVAKVVEGMTPLSIQRLNKERMITIGARTSGVPLGRIADQINEIVSDLNLPPNIGVKFGGELKQQAETQGDLGILLILGILLVYLVMSAQFESFLDPFVIIFSIPFAITGVFLGLLITGFALSLPAFLGTIILVGIVVNNAIVLVDYINMLRREKGLELNEAIATAGERRLRPILMTAFTTIFGMLPLALFKGQGHEMWQPMGIAVVFGLLISTLVTLVLIPTLYAATERFRRAVAIDAADVENNGGETP